MKEDIDKQEFNHLVELIKSENPKIDIEFCKYFAGSYLYQRLEKEKSVSIEIDE